MVGFAALGPLPFGWMFDLTGGYTTAILVFLAMPTACARGGAARSSTSEAGDIGELAARPTTEEEAQCPQQTGPSPRRWWSTSRG